MLMRAIALNLLPSNRDDDGVFRPLGPSPAGAPREDLVYTVEVRGVHIRPIDTVVAQAATVGTAWAAYYAAMREYPGAVVTIRHHGAILASTAGRH
jgi:hypothetical protein